ncbi:hypothetical protein K466DRAFT_652928 [Polyporus arcularius HHB13444]|uniref:F-box domain-containing protein n=1 Tax=Polyporus arcularius HHB13444 TaxID=1314778 RepID=A0A5C3PFU4_9APHY|nr:hypothetical protein K466DRAFT_652928 [Polyporus arcularius HHB13444]
MRPFPQELSDHVIDYVAPDCIEGPSKHYADLLACALTCQSWLPRAQYQLYKHVELRLFDSMRLFARTLEQSPNLCRLVKRLEFWFDEEDWDQQPSDMQDVPFPTHLIGGLMSLQGLRFACCMDGETAEADVQKDFMREWTTCTQLRMLHIDYYASDTLEELVRLVWSFPLLQELRVSETAWTDRGEIDPSEFPGHCQHLTVVEMLQIYDEDQFLPFLGTSIRRLSIGSLWDSPGPHNFAGNCLATAALSTFLDLRTLVIEFVVLEYPWLENVLGEVRSAHLEELVLDFSDHDGLEVCARQGLDDLLSRKHLESLRRLKIILHDNTVDVERRLRMAEKLLPRFMKRGTIEMDVVTELGYAREDEDEDMEWLELPE